MKKVLVIVAVVLIFLCILGAVLFKVLSRSSSQLEPTTGDQNVLPTGENIFAAIIQKTGPLNTITPEQSVQTCYRMYIYFFSGSYSWHVTQGNPPAEIQRCFTPSFYKELSASITEIDSGDALIQNQYADQEWVSTIKTNVLSQSATESSVLITFGTATTEIIRLRVGLVYSLSTGWRINSVVRAE